MDRLFSRRLRRLSALALAASVVIASGCMGPMLTAMYLFGAADMKAEYDGLKKQNVVVVCHPLTDLQYSNMHAAKDIAEQIGQKLKANVSGLKLVDQQKVDKWMDENQWEESVEIGRALEADKVVVVELENFSVLLGQTLYQGQASYVLKVVDCETGETEYDVTPNPVCWPPNSPIPTQEKPECRFRKQFIGVLADQIARHFYAHDARAYFAEDATAIDD